MTPLERFTNIATLTNKVENGDTLTREEKIQLVKLDKQLAFCCITEREVVTFIKEGILHGDDLAYWDNTMEEVRYLHAQA